MIRGVIPILHTPFLDDGSLDLESLRREVKLVCDAGAAGMAFPGFASEWWKLSQAEILEAAAVIREESAGRSKVIFNVTAQSTYLAVQQVKDFLRLGADALMCLPPFVVPASPDAVVAHLERVLDAGDVPHILQYAASLTGIKLSTEQLGRMRERYPHFRTIKVDFIPPGPMITSLVSAFGDGAFDYLIGYSGLQLPDSMARGATGLMGGVGHVEIDLQVFRALQQDPLRGLDLFRRLLPMLNFEMQTIDMTIATHKRLLHERGVFRSDHVRAPGMMLDELQRAEMRRHLEYAQLTTLTGLPATNA